VQVQRLLGEATALFGNTCKDLQWAENAAAYAQCYTSSYRLSHCLMLLLIERAKQLQSFKHTTMLDLLSGLQDRPTAPAMPWSSQPAATSSSSAAAAATSGSGTRHHQILKNLKDAQQRLLKQAEQVGEAAERLFARQRQQLLQSAEGNLMEQHEVLQMRHADIEAIQQLSAKLPNVAAELTADNGLDAAEVAAVLAAVMKGEGGWQSNLQSFMQGHLYSCPNGHLFVIGECGGAMQVMSCSGPACHDEN
jgi:hypothetical protein